MKLQDLKKRIIPDMDTELAHLIECFQNNQIPSCYANMDEAIAVAKSKDSLFDNDRLVLGVSIGGSNTKLILMRCKDKQFCVEYIASRKNPTDSTTLYEYLDLLLKNDSKIRDYLTNNSNPCIGFSIPMRIIEGVIYHPTKLAFLSTGIGRKESDIKSEMDFKKLFAEHMKSRGFSTNYNLVYQPDGWVAHHGAISLCLDIKPGDKSVLLVTGTGSATSDEAAYIVPALIQGLADDEELFPLAKTENRQFMYAISGKGLFLIMKQALLLQEADSSSSLYGYELSSMFSSADDSYIVGKLAEVHHGFSEDSDIIEQIKSSVSSEAFSEACQIADFIITRSALSQANTVLATLSFAPAPKPGKNTFVFFEGSIATNIVVLPKIKERINTMAARSEFFTSLSAKPIVKPCMEVNYMSLHGNNEQAVPMLSQADLSLVGSATMVIAVK